jgi:hypothetical protein
MVGALQRINQPLCGCLIVAGIADEQAAQSTSLRKGTCAIRLPATSAGYPSSTITFAFFAR